MNIACGFATRMYLGEAVAQCTGGTNVLQLQTTGAWSRSLWLFDPRAADIQAIEGMKSSILSASARWEILQVIGGRGKEEG